LFLIEPEVLKSMPWTLLDELDGGTIFAPPLHRRHPV